MSNPFYVYIIKCSDDSLYTGIATNLERRLRQHNGKIVGGAVYTRNKRPVKLVHTEEYGTHLAASRREISIKKLSRVNKEKLFLK